MVYDSGFIVYGSGFRVYGLGWCLIARDHEKKDLWFRFQGLGSRA